MHIVTMMGTMAIILIDATIVSFDFMTMVVTDITVVLVFIGAIMFLFWLFLITRV